MSKKVQKDVKEQMCSDSVKNTVNIIKIDENLALETVVGATNVKRWILLKATFLCKTNQQFTTKLLDLAQDYLNRNPCSKKDANFKRGDKESDKSKRKKNETKKEKKEAFSENTKPELIIEEAKPAPTAENIDHTTNIKSAPNNEKDEKAAKKKVPFNPNKSIKKDKTGEQKRKMEHDIRKAPELGLQIDNKPEVKIEEECLESTGSRVAIKIKLCQNCNTRHIQDHCPLNYPNFIITDSMNLTEWQEKYQELHANQLELDKENEDENKYAFAKLSIPNFLHFMETNSGHGLGVWTKIDIQSFTQFGPLIGKVVKEVDISEDSHMRDLWEICSENGNIYFSTEDLENSNWIRFIRPAPTRDDRNLTLISKDSLLYFISSKAIKSGEELLYWQDFNITTNKKKLEKTCCGGCNMTFAHPLYYRIHCSVFHDIRYSLTIRKYHCKVCGAAVLGKENIMKHAAELHNGQGAYQCQFCKKFFLRLNYLEMHRTYGCSANPHRSRPLCDFCGRKFCQPQKLKVHIKRMHSDFSEVLKEFQCKSCLKILGSRAALQRHLKEVHQKQLDGACSCSRCGKHFQNKSNLKIHMLTHSGIKPFKCVVKSCNAAFTTKQCLQFHYKKVHSFNEEIMPKIERSIDYTFEAYSGLDEQEEKKDESTKQNECTNNLEGEESEGDDQSVDSQKLDDPPPMAESPILAVDQSPNPSPSYNNTTMKILSKGSKKWIGDPPDIYQMNKDELGAHVQIPVDSQQNYERTNKLNTANLNDFQRHEASNASLLVEAALDSVCSEPNIDIDVSTTPNCTADALVNNLYTLAPADTLPDVTYSESVCINDHVNDHISVTDDQNIGIDYSGFHQEDFSPGNSPELHHRNNFVRNYINTLSPNQGSYTASKGVVSPGTVPSPPRYDFGHQVATDHLSSDDSNGMGAQNLSLHSNKHDIQLDLSIYKSPYNPSRRLKFDGDDENNPLEGQPDLSTNIEVVDLKEKENVEVTTDSIIRNKFDIDLDLRLKNYELESETLRTRGLYEADLEFRNKNYDLIENLESRSGAAIDTDFRTDRNFEPLVLNSSELQGLDMSARSFHNYPNINRYHHLYPDVDRVDLRLNYSPPTSAYTHADILRVVSLDLTPPGRHSVDLSLRTHPLHQIANSRLLPEPHRLLDQSRLLSSDLSGRILSDHTTNRILSNNDQLGSNHLLSSADLNDSRIISDQPRLLEQSRLIATGDGRLTGGAVSPIPAFSGYSVSQSPYHPTPLAPRPHVSSPTPTPYHHYSTYY